MIGRGISEMQPSRRMHGITNHADAALNCRWAFASSSAQEDTKQGSVFMATKSTSALMTRQPKPARSISPSEKNSTKSSLEIFDCEQGTEEWASLRLGIPTASRFADVMAGGEGKMRTRYLRELAGEIISRSE